MRITQIAALVLTGLATLITRVEAGPLTEQQARLKAAQWVRGPMFSEDRSAAGPAANKSVAEILSHIRESLLAVGGNTGYCGVIREPTWRGPRCVTGCGYITQRNPIIDCIEGLVYENMSI
jgi:hypothetical protein